VLNETAAMFVRLSFFPKLGLFAIYRFDLVYPLCVSLLHRTALQVPATILPGVALVPTGVQEDSP